MRNTKKVIIASIVILLLIVGVLIYNMLVKKEDVNDNVEQEDYQIKVETKKVNNSSDFFTIDNYINEYINYASEKNENVYYLLDNNYIKDNNITKENFTDFIHDVVEENSEFITMSMNVIESGNFSTYVVYGIISDYNNPKGKEAYIIVNLDLYNRTFSIKPLLNASYNSIDDINLQVNEEDISKNDYNLFEYYMITDENLCREYIEHYRYNAIYNPEKIYEMLDSEYKQKRFETLEEFKKYVEYKKNDIENIIMTKYSVEQKGSVKEYIVVDMYENYYKFTEKNIMDYTLILDNYSIKPDNFEELYSKAAADKKVITNIDIFIKMLNNKDYKNAYKVLSEGFKNKYFKTLNEFEKYAEENFFDHNYSSIKNVEATSNAYICDVTIKSGTNLAAGKMTKTIIIGLKEGTDFELSFNVE